MRRLLIVSMLLWATPAFAQLGSVPHVFSSGTAISSSDMNVNFSTAYGTALNRTGGTMTGSIGTQLVFPNTTAAYDIGAILAKYRDGWFSRDVYIGRDISSTGAGTFTGTITAANLTTAGTLTANAATITTLAGGNGTFSGTLGVSGAATLSSAVITNGATVGSSLTVGTTLGVSGASTFSGAITATSQTITAGAINTTTGAISTTLSAGSFSAGSAAVSGATTLGTNTTSGLTTLNGGLTANSGINVTAGTIVLQTTVNMTAASGDGIDMDIVGAKAIQFARGGVVSGNITMSGGVTTYGTTSDRRLKNDLGPTRTGLETLMALQVRDYTMKSDFGAVRHTGFMAQQVAPLVPDAVIVPAKPQDYYEMDYGRLTPLLVKSIQDQQQQMELLKQDLINLQMEVARLRAVR